MPLSDASTTHVIHFTSRIPRVLTVLVAVVTALATLAAPAEAETSTVVRVAGDDRVETAVAVSEHAWSSAAHAVVTTAEDYPDALAAAAYAAATDAPILLTPSDRLPGSVAAELQRLGVQDVTILGGSEAIAPGVEAAIDAVVPEVDRIEGETRYDTARQLAQEVGTGHGGRVALALGSNHKGLPGWADALSAGSLSAIADPIPALLTAGDALPDATRAALQDLEPDEVLLVGGEAAISGAIAAEVEALGLPTRRLAGSNRYRTSVAVADEAHDAGVPVDDFVFASGQGFPDALSASAFAAKEAAPMLLVPSTRLADGVDAHLRSAAEQFDDGLLVGGPSAIDEFVRAELHAALRGLERPQPPEPEPEPEPVTRQAAPSHNGYTFRFDLAIWDRLAQCESGGNWSINTGNGYYGGLQFSLSSWRAVGGSGYPHHHSRLEQIYRGERLQKIQGWGAWPACSRKIGLR